MDCCEKKMVSGQLLAACACTTNACKGRCQTLVTDTHIDRKICPKHLRGAPGTIHGVPMRYCQRVRSLLAFARCLMLVQLLCAAMTFKSHIVAHAYDCACGGPVPHVQAARGQLYGGKEVRSQPERLLPVLAGLLRMEYYCLMI